MTRLQMGRNDRQTGKVCTTLCLQGNEYCMSFNALDFVWNITDKVINTWKDNFLFSFIFPSLNYYPHSVFITALTTHLTVLCNLKMSNVSWFNMFSAKLIPPFFTFDRNIQHMIQEGAAMIIITEEDIHDMVIMTTLLLH